MALLTTQKTSRTPSAQPTYSNSSASDTFVANANTLVLIKNSSGSSITVGVDSVVACDQGFDHNETITVANNETRIAGPFPPRFRDSGGLVTLTPSVTGATVQFAVIEP